PVVNTQQIGWYSRAGAVVTGSSPAGNNVNQLVHTFLMNYMSASGLIAPDNMGAFLQIFTDLGINHGLGDLTNEAYVQTLMALSPIAPPPPP
ncbi:MAG: hypothetical protein OEZ33_11325, partial [Gammaproteobacteria bacterium]|nr:hypothetical protein [Gammaproteobacteria bacterium]